MTWGNIVSFLPLCNVTGMLCERMSLAAIKDPRDLENELFDHSMHLLAYSRVLCNNCTCPDQVLSGRKCTFSCIFLQSTLVSAHTLHS